MMRIGFILAVMAAVLPGGMLAAQTAVSLIISMADGTRHIVDLNDRPVVRIIGEKLNVIGDMTELNFDIDKVRNFTYGSLSGINHGEVCERFEKKGESLIFTGEGGPLEIVLTAVNGVVLKSVNVTGGETYVMPMDNLIPGIYIVTVNGVSTEIVKR